jgi:hypothetical protein
MHERWSIFNWEKMVLFSGLLDGEGKRAGSIVYGTLGLSVPGTTGPSLAFSASADRAGKICCKKGKEWLAVPTPSGKFR